MKLLIIGIIFLSTHFSFANGEANYQEQIRQLEMRRQMLQMQIEQQQRHNNTMRAMEVLQQGVNNMNYRPTPARSPSSTECVTRPVTYMNGQTHYITECE